MKVKTLTDIKSIAEYLRRIGAEPRSLRTAVVRESHGAYWKDIAVVTIAKDGTVKAPPAFEPTEQEATLIKANCATAEWPHLQKLPRLRDLPDMLKNADAESLFEFRDENGEIIMVQQRVDDK